MPEKNQLNYNLKHETKRHALGRFLILLIIITAYLFWMVWRFGARGGVEVTLLTWSFFVFCTPIADAGFLVAFPTRLFLKIRMLTSQIYVFFIALLLDIYFFIFQPEIFQKTFLLKVFQKIIEKPWPYWIIILLSILGTFFSIYFGDELFDTALHKQRVKFKKHRLKHRLIIAAFLFVATVILYEMLIKNLGINISL